MLGVTAALLDLGLNEGNAEDALQNRVSRGPECKHPGGGEVSASTAESRALPSCGGGAAHSINSFSLVAALTQLDTRSHG